VGTKKDRFTSSNRTFKKPISTRFSALVNAFLLFMRNSSRGFGDVADGDFVRILRELETVPAITEDAGLPSKDSNCDCQLYELRKAEPVA
jgi:hypothetical protein